MTELSAPWIYHLCCWTMVFTLSYVSPCQKRCFLVTTLFRWHTLPGDLCSQVLLYITWYLLLWSDTIPPGVIQGVGRLILEQWINVSLLPMVGNTTFEELLSPHWLLQISRSLTSAVTWHRDARRLAHSRGKPRIPCKVITTAPIMFSEVGVFCKQSRPVFHKLCCINCLKWADGHLNR